MDALLMGVTAVLVLLFFGVLLFSILDIERLLSAIGGDPTSMLAKLRLGLRAIETETGHLPPSVGAVNEGLSSAADGLSKIDQGLKDTIEAALRQEGA